MFSMDMHGYYYYSYNNELADVGKLDVTQQKLIALSVLCMEASPYPPKV